MIGDALRVLQCPAIKQIGGNSGGTEGVAAGRRGESCRFRSPLDHLEDFQTVHASLGEISITIGRAEEGRGNGCRNGSRAKRGIDE